MPKFSANLTMLFTEVGFFERFERAAMAGFKAVEYMFPYTYDGGHDRRRTGKIQSHPGAVQFPAGNWEAGERGIALLPGREEEFKDGVERAISFAKTLKCSSVNCLVGLTPDAPPVKVRETLVGNLRFAAEKLGKENIRLLIESLNTRDIPGFYLTTPVRPCPLSKRWITRICFTSTTYIICR